MDVFEQREVLKTFTVICDTREQDTARARRRYAAFGVPYRRGTLSYGDYTYDAVLPGGAHILDADKTAEPLCAVERKMNLDELAQCFTRGRKRFQNEFERAAANGCRITLLVENASWENLYNGKYRTKFAAAAFVGSVHAWANRYGMNLIFCKEETSGKIIRDILYRDLKERLERGEFG